MKKLITSVLIPLLILVTVSCKPQQADPLGYQVYPFSAKGSLSANQTEYVFEVCMTDKNSGRVCFTSPDSLRGYTFNVTPEGTTLSYGDMTIDFSNNGEKTNVVNLIPEIFSLSSENLISREDTTQNSVELILAAYSSGKGEVKVYVNKSTGHPMRFEYGQTVISITEFTPCTPSTSTPTPTPTPNISPEPTPYN